MLYTRLIYSKGPKPYIATLPDPNNQLLVFESIERYIPLLGVMPANDGIPSSNVIVLIVAIAPVFAVVVTTVVQVEWPPLRLHLCLLIFLNHD